MTNKEKKKILKKAKWEKEFCEKEIREKDISKERKDFATRRLDVLNILIPRMEREVK